MMVAGKHIGKGSQALLNQGDGNIHDLDIHGGTFLGLFYGRMMAYITTKRKPPSGDQAHI
ncbi:hypothetical protein IOK_17641 [Yersinia enterocolitica subsp. palearctica PhRBD_Ye1]|nr:hypothetical protein IOK_17641 [Yersinia enterocolitica subsp. palearctica PhRBD_Ye1]